jgi:nucleoside-diphosphate-sugar epimerase
VRVLSDGTPRRTLVHAKDIARAYALCLEAPAAAISRRAFNIGTEANNLTVAEIANTVCDTVAGSELLITGESGADPRAYRVDFSRARAELGFEASWSVADGAAELHAAYTSYGLTQEDFEKKFTRLPRLVALRSREVIDDTMRRVSADA